MAVPDQLRTLLELARNGFSVTETARVLNTSQPGISRRILSLEKELGIELLRRRGRHIKGFSPAGEQIALCARQALQNLQTLEQIAADFRDEESGELNLVTTHTQARYAMPPAVRAFCRRYPSVQLHIHQAPPELMAAMVRNGEADLAIATESFEHFEDLIVLPCYRWKRALLVQAEHPLAAQGELKSLDQLAGEQLITYSFGLRGPNGLLAQCRRNGLEPDIVLTAADAEVIKSYVREGLGLGLVAGMAVHEKTDRDLRTLEVSRFFSLQTSCIALRKDSQLRAFTQFFISSFAPHLNAEIIAKAQSAEQRRKVQSLFADIEMEIR